METQFGYCHCGCGLKTNIAKESDSRYDHKKGKPVRFIKYHYSKHTCERKPIVSWKYIKVFRPEHPKASRGYVREHIIISEKALGKPLPQNAVVHHHNKIELVICQNHSYHMLIHQRTRALEACGHVNWIKCEYCHNYDDPSNMYIRPKQNQGYHRSCANISERKRYAALKEVR